jgi:hypothetical protein
MHKNNSTPNDATPEMNQQEDHSLNQHEQNIPLATPEADVPKTQEEFEASLVRLLFLYFEKN